MRYESTFAFNQSINNQNGTVHIRKSAMGLSLLLSLIFILFGCGKDEDPNIPDSGKIKTDKSILVHKESLPTSGGMIQIQGSASVLNGLEIELPEGSYHEVADFSISYSEILSHDFGPLFQPVSPLIEINNGGKLSNQLMRLKVPVIASPDAYKMAFYYDRASGELEGISVLSQKENFVEVIVRHFSLIVITQVQKELLIGGGGFHTSFDPSRNGWGFVNYGSYPEYDGICAGMSIGAAYYFKNFKAGLALNSYFDNDQLWFPSPDVWEDDANGLRFATAIHRVQEAFWDNNLVDVTQIVNATDSDRFFNLIYSILILNQPQLIYLSDPAAPIAHMIVAFGYQVLGKEVKINVYDPNFPNQESTISYNLETHSFSKYTSAQNARALENNQLFNYSQIAFVPLSSVMSKSEMDFLWQKVQNKTIEDGLFPAYKVFAVPKDNSYSKVELNTRDNSAQNYIPFTEFDFQIEGVDPGTGVKLEALSFLPGFGLERYNPAKTIIMENRDTLIGLYLKATPTGQSYEQWVGFEWFKIRLQDVWIEPSDTTISTNAEIKFIARNNGTLPKNAVYKWDFGDGHKSESRDSAITYKYEEAEEYTVELKVFDPSGVSELVKVNTKITVADWLKIAVVLKGMDSNPPSTMKASDDTDIPSMAWSSWSIPNAPPLQWNNNNFVVDFPFTIGDFTYTARISGTMSADFKKVISLSGIVTGFGLGGDWTYQAAISLYDFPIEEYLPGEIIGKILKGPQAQAKVGNITWKQTIKDNQGQVTEITLKSIDWSSSQTELSIFFYNK